MITVAVLEVFNPSTRGIEEICVTSGTHFILGTKHCAPLITGTFTFSQTILRNSLTESGVVLDEGDVTLNAMSGSLDQYKDYGFAGRTIKLYRVESEETAVNPNYPSFVGKMGVPVIGLEEWVIPITSRQQDLEKVLSVAVFEEELDDPNTYIGGEVGVQGRTKPRLFGRCFSIQPFLLNNYLQIYGCNFDKDGNPTSVEFVHNVYSRGGRYSLQGVASDLNDLLTYVTDPGKYVVLPSMGLVRLGTPPTGTVTMDVSTTVEELCTVANLVDALFRDLGMDTGSDYDSGQLSSLDVPLPAGVYITSNETALDVITQLLQSIGAWGIPDKLGIYRFGKLEGVPTSSKLLITEDHFLKGSLKRLPYKTETGVPINKLEFQHTRFWTQVNDSLPSIGPVRTSRLRTEWDVCSVEDSQGLSEVHPTASSETVSTLLAIAPVLEFQDGSFYGQPFAGWWDTNPPQSWDYKNGSDFDLKDCDSCQQVMATQLISDPLRITLEYSSYTAGSLSSCVINGNSVATPVGIREKVEFTETNPYSSLSLSLTKVLGQALELHSVECDRPDLVSLLNSEARRRFSLAAGIQDCYELVIPLDLGVHLACGDGVTLQVSRLGLDSGLDFTIVGLEENWEAEELTLTLWRSQYVA